MGGRGAFKNIDSKDFTFVEGGQTYVKVGEVAGVEVLIRRENYQLRLLNILIQQVKYMLFCKMVKSNI